MKSRYQGTRNGGVAASDRGADFRAGDAPLTDGEFLGALEACTLLEAQFDHAAHVRAGSLYLRQQPFPQATAAMCTAVRNYARALGKPERYHETITIG